MKIKRCLALALAMTVAMPGVMSTGFANPNQETESVSLSSSEMESLAETEEFLPYQNTSLSFEERAADLVSRMTLEEKVTQFTDEAASIPRLKVAEYNYWEEALHGVARQGAATSFPSPLSMSNTWNRDLIKQMATITSTEARAMLTKANQKKTNAEEWEKSWNLSYWSPTINMARDPRWGRNEETMGEDPYLTAQLGSEFVEGMQGDDPKYLKTISTLKHYVANNVESERSAGSSVLDETTLREYYGKAFQDIMERSNAASVMSAYNATTISRNGEILEARNGQKIDYIAASANSYILNDLLRRNWGFEGYITGDCAAFSNMNTKASLKKGLFPSRDISKVPVEEVIPEAFKNGADIDCSLSGGGGAEPDILLNAIEGGYLTEDELDRSLYRLFLTRMRTGEFDKGAMYQNISADVIESDEHVAVAEALAEESWVLLKNDDNVLPIKEDDKKIAIVGSLAGTVVLGDYSGSPTKNTDPVTGITEEVKAIYPNSTVSYIGGVTSATKLANIKSIKLVDKNGKETVLDLSKVKIDDGEKILKSGAVYSDGIIKNVTTKTTLSYAQVDFSKVKTIKIESETISEPGALMQIRYGKGGPIGASLTSPTELNSYGISEAEYDGEDGGYNGKADLWITFLGNVPEFSISEYKDELDSADMIIAYGATMYGREPAGDSGESNDRESINLPSTQSHVQAIANAYPDKTVVVMQAVGQFNVEPFMDKCKAMLWTSYNGQTQGTALGKVLTGQVSPSGKLTTTWYSSSALKNMQFSVSATKKDGISFWNNDYGIKSNGSYPGRTYQYHTQTPVYPFGYGLSYASFEYSNAKIDKETVDANDTVNFSVDVTNTGAVKAKETVQLYISAPGADGVNIPKQQLKGFEKVEIAAGETKTVTIPLNIADLKLFDEKNQKVYVNAGEYTAKLAQNSASEDAVVKFNVTGELESTLKNVTAIPDKLIVKGYIREDGTALESASTVNSDVSAIMTDEVWLPLSEADVKYTSSDESIATVDNSGIVSSGTKEGVAVITVTVTKNGVTKSDLFPVVNMLEIKPSEADITEAKANVTAAYNRLQKVAYSDDNWAQVDKLYNDGLETVENAKTKELLSASVAEIINSLNSVPMDNLTDVYKVSSVNPKYVEKGVIDYRDGGIPVYSGAEGTITESAPFAGIQLQATDENGNVIDKTKLIWQIKKFDNSKRKVAEITTDGVLTVYGNGIVQVTAADVENLKCGTMMIQINMQIEAEYADDNGGADLGDSQSGASGGYNAGSTANAWMEYKSVKLSNLDGISVRYAGKNDGTLNISLDKSVASDKLIATKTLSASGGWSSWTDDEIEINSTVIDEAQKSGLLDTYGCVTVYVQTNGVNLDYLRLNYIENNDDIPYIIEKVTNKTNGRVKATLKYRGSTLAEDVLLVAEVLNADGSVKSSAETTICGTGEYEITTGARAGETIRLTVKDSTGRVLSEADERIYKEPVDSEIEVYTLDSTEYDYSTLTGGTDGSAYVDTVNGLSGYGGWNLSTTGASYTYTDVNEKTYDYKFTKSWQAGSGGETKRSLYFTPKSECRVTAVFKGSEGRDMYISQGGKKIATGLGSGQVVGFGVEITDLTQPVYVYGGSSNKNLFAIIVEYYGKEENPPPTDDPTPTDAPTPTPDIQPEKLGASLEYTDGAVKITSDETRTAQLIHAQYTGMLLMEVDITEVALKANETVTVNKTDIKNGDKLMLWSSMEEMMPLSIMLVVENAEVAGGESETYEIGEDIAVQYTDWGNTRVLLTKNDVTGETKLWTISAGGTRMPMQITRFYEYPDMYKEGDSITINTLSEYKGRLYAGCDGGLIAIFTECSKCNRLKWAVPFDIKGMNIENGVMYISGESEDMEIDMNELGGDSIEFTEAEVLMLNGAMLVDVRTAEEFNESAISSAVNIPVDELETELADYDKEAVLIFYCSAGTRSAKAVEIAKDMGFVSVYALENANEFIKK